MEVWTVAAVKTVLVQHSSKYLLSQKKEPHLEEVEGELMMTVSKWSSLNENDFHLGELSI